MEKVEQLLNDEDWRAHCEARLRVTKDIEKKEKRIRREENVNVMNIRIYIYIFI